MTKIKRIGIFGVHRTGKTWLAKELGERYDLPYYPSNAEKVFSKHSVDAAVLPDFAKVLQIQRDILIAHLQPRSQQHRYVMDRTGVDFLAYTLAHAECTGIQDSRIQEYMQKCLRSLTTFNVLIHIPRSPLLNTGYTCGKGSEDADYIQHLKAQYAEVMAYLGHKVVTIPPELPLGSRVDYVINELNLMGFSKPDASPTERQVMTTPVKLEDK